MRVVKLKGSPFVGRDAELATLRAGLEGALRGAGSIVMLHGEAGIGKTRTAAEFSRYALDHGSLVLWGRCYERDWSPPYGPWVGAITQRVEQLDPERLAALLGSGARVLAGLVPAIGTALPGLPEAALLTAEEGRFRLHDAAARFLAGSPEPLVVVLDDLHWADRPSLDLLRYVAPFVADSRLLVVGTYRGVELELAHPLAQCLAELNRQRLCERVLLGSLAFGDSVTLLEGLLETELPVNLAAGIYAESGGNPYFLEEIVRHLEERKDGVLTCRSLEEWGIPESVRQAVGLRMGRLSTETNRMLGVAAAFTAGFGFAELEALTELPEDALLDCIDEALRAELIRPAPGHEQYDFSHTILRHTLYDELSPSRKARLHRRIAQALEQVHQGREHEFAAELASQYHASASLPGAAHGVPYALAAAEHARSAHAFEQAVTLLRMARTMAAASEVSVRGAVACKLALAEAEALSVDEAQASVEEALLLLEAGQASDEEVADFLRTVASALQDAGARQESLEPLIKRGLSVLGDARGLAWARLKVLEQPLEPIAAGPVHAGRWLGFDAGAVRVARASGDENDYARTLEIMDWRSRSETEDLLTLVESWRLPAPRIHGLSVVLRSLLLAHGALAEGEQVCLKLLTLAEEVGSLPGQAYALTYLAGVHGARGDFALAAASAARANALTARLGPGHRLGVSLSLVERLAAQHVELDWSGTSALFRRVATDPRTPAWIALLYASCAAYAFARAGDGTETRRLLGWTMFGLREAEPTTLAQNGAVAHAAAAVWELGELALAADLRRAARALLEEGVGDYFTTSNELTVARMAALLGHFDEASEYFERSRHVLEASGQRPLRAIVDYDEALMLRRLGRPEAGQLLARARSQFEERGMTSCVSRAYALATGSFPNGGHRWHDGLTRREVEVIRLLAGGRTNREIAGELVVSVHTVERHVANVYRKLNVRNRSDATAYVLRTGL